MANYIDDYTMDVEKYPKDIEKCGQVFVYGTLKTGGEIRGPIAGSEVPQKAKQKLPPIMR